MNYQRLTVLTIVLLVLITVFLGGRYYALYGQLRQIQNDLEVQKINGKILDFTNLFIDRVLKAKQEVSFETRLQLENAVRELNDKEILAQWQKFTDSQTAAKAQDEVKSLLEILVSKIRVK